MNRQDRLDIQAIESQRVMIFAVSSRAARKLFRAWQQIARRYQPLARDRTRGS